MKKEPYLTYEECIKKYPRLTRMLQGVLIGSPGEAGCCIRDYRNGLDFSCEAVSHSGLTPLDRIQSAFKNRHLWRRMYHET